MPNPSSASSLLYDYGWPCTEGSERTPQYTDWLV
jgi:hypothetical protein